MVMCIYIYVDTNRPCVSTPRRRAWRCTSRPRRRRSVIGWYPLSRLVYGVNFTLIRLQPTTRYTNTHVDAQAQLKIRELLEDTPSMVAFSTARSALQKRGLLFLVEVRIWDPGLHCLVCGTDRFDSNLLHTNRWATA